MYKLFLCLRYLRKRHMVFFAIAAVTLCTAMVLIVISVMGGFLDMVKDRSRGLLGDIILDGTLQGFPYYQEFIDEELEGGMPDVIEVVDADPEVQRANLAAQLEGQDEKRFSEKEVATYFGTAPRTLRDWCTPGRSDRSRSA